MAGNTRTDAAPDAPQQPPSSNGEGPASAAEESSAQQQAPEEHAAPGQDAERERLVAELETLRKKFDTAVRAVQAAEKDREEFKQRVTRERERMLDVERGNVAVTLLEAIDELDRCLSASAQDTSPLAEGVRMIRDVLLRKAQETGIERFNVVGQTFDPNLSEAADMEITASPDEDQRIVAELRAGYRLKERVIRPARVKVAKYIAPAQA
ncbi:nucleotide exchange factor GrpE [Myxococcus sp. AM009]|uniref:nucleotide exchange factor GrpE n=1 Tax=unclassified Myxococcus TaxID=2648731 RepID=UPI001594F84E|nr:MULTISPECIES: nucleotide exchange factor GrpE [unclassified Myxococcus]NVJ00544.1 nucleotide exchange factor GrpE [Myxococcus sp. AM009]NVJ12733.1 nucleotide exchange factor GrpE [Myxococcus sp. AM010]